MISFLDRGRPYQSYAGFLSFFNNTRVAGNHGICISCNSRYRKTVVESFFIKPKLKIVYDPEDETAEHISETEDHTLGILEDRDNEIITSDGIPIRQWSSFYPKRHSLK